MSDIFEKAIWESLDGNLKVYKREDRYYYKEDYKKYFVKVYDIKHSKELTFNKKSKTSPICSIASSGRLCALYFHNIKNKKPVSFEEGLCLDIKYAKAWLDAKEGNTYYECKCQEILGRSHDLLSENYLNSNLFKDLINGYKEEDIKIIEKLVDGKTKKFIIFDVKLLGIELDAYKRTKGNYNNFHFDIKQLICHLIALAKANQEGKKKILQLQYVFFVPKNYKGGTFKDVYDRLDNEIDKIKDSKKIKKFCENHNIELFGKNGQPIFYEVNNLKSDKAIEEYKKKKEQ